MSEKADFYREYDLIKCRKHISKKPEATHQKEAIINLKNWFESKKFPSGSIIALPTGSGKTFTAVRFLCRNVIANDYKVLWLAHTHHLLEQAFYSFGPLSEDYNEGYEVGWIPEPKESLNVRVVSGATNQFNINQIKQEDDILIATLQSIANAFKNRHPKLEEFLKSTKGKLFIVFDEAHHAPAPSYRNLICKLRERFPKMHLMGLTATPTTSDINKRGWFSVLFPQKIIHQTSIEKLMAEAIIAKPIIKEAETDFNPDFDERLYLKWDDAKTDLPTRIVTQLAENIDRNKRIVETYVKNKSIYGKTIIFADRWYQCDSINTLLNSAGVSSDVVYHQMGNEKNAETLEKFKKNQLEVIVNIKMLTEGTDVPDLDTVFITRQTTSTILMTQMVGRALRGPKFGGKPNANLVFFHDDWNKTINWAVWDTESWEAVKMGDPEPTPGKLKEPTDISRKEILRLLDMMDSGINVNPGPFLIFMPIGWFKLTIAEINEEGNPEEIDRLIMVFENEYNHYLDLIEYFKKEDLTVFDDEKVYLDEYNEKIEIWRDIFFDGTEKYVGDLSANIFAIVCHMAQNMKESPRFIKFEERKNHDLEAIARDFIERDYGPAIVSEKLKAEYERIDRFWKVIYYDYIFFKFQYNSLIEWILDQDGIYYEPIIDKENHLTDILKRGTTKERIRAIEELGDMGLEETIHEKTIRLIEKIAINDEDIKVRDVAKCMINLIGKLSLNAVEKKLIKERDGYHCLCCGEETKRYLEVDHIKPRYYEVDNSEDNLQTLCKICNITKSTKTIDFRKKKTLLSESPSEFPNMDKIDALDEWSIRDLKFWDKFLKRSINFFYQCQAVKLINLNNKRWEITLNENNPPQWIYPFMIELTEKIKTKREEYGFFGPENILLIKKEPNECKELIETLKTSNSHRQRTAATRLGHLKCEKAVYPLINLIKSSDTFSTPAAALALGNIGDLRAIKPLIKMLKRKNFNFRQAAMRSLIKFDNSAVEDLILGLKNSDFHTRQLSAEALGEIRNAKAIDNLIECLQDKESPVRWMAARSLGKIGNIKAIKPLKESLKDPNEKVREESSKALLILEGETKSLFESLDEGIKQINDAITRNKTKNGYSYFTPNRLFVHVYQEDNSIELLFYMGNEKIKGVKKVKTGILNSRLYLKNSQELPNTLNILNKSYNLMKSWEAKKQIINYKMFWKKILKETRELNPEIPDKKPYQGSYFPIFTGYRNVHFEWMVRKKPKEHLMVCLHFENPNKSDNLKLLNYFISRRNEIEKKILDEEVFFDENFLKKWTQIYITRDIATLDEENLKWGAKAMVQLYNALKPILDEFYSEEKH